MFIPANCPYLVGTVPVLTPQKERGGGGGGVNLSCSPIIKKNLPREGRKCTVSEESNDLGNNTL